MNNKKRIEQIQINYQKLVFCYGTINSNVDHAKIITNNKLQQKVAFTKDF